MVLFYIIQISTEKVKGTTGTMASLLLASAELPQEV